jgi:hypothetical protein
MADMNNNSGSVDGTLVKPPENMMHPRDYVGTPTAHEQTEGKGKNTILKLSLDQDFNNASQGTGIAGPAVWGGPADKKATQSSSEAGSKQADPYSVDLVSGQNSCWNGGRVSSKQ